MRGERTSFRALARLMAPPLFAAVLFGCAESHEAEADPASGANAAAMADPIVDPLQDEKAPSGRWSQATVEGRAALVYEWGASPTVALSCDERQGINVDLRGQVPVPPTEMMRISTTGETSLYAVNALQGQNVVRATIPANDVMIAALMRGGPIRINFGDDEAIALAASPLVPPFVVSCRES